MISPAYKSQTQTHIHHQAAARTGRAANAEHFDPHALPQICVKKTRLGKSITCGICYSKALPLVIMLAFCLICPVQAAETTGNSLPYESWLRSLQQSLTGPVAFSVALIGIVCCGATLIFAGGEIGRFMRALIYIVMVMTMLIGANSLMSKFFNGASIGDEALLRQQYEQQMQLVRAPEPKPVPGLADSGKPMADPRGTVGVAPKEPQDALSKLNRAQQNLNEKLDAVGEVSRGANRALSGAERQIYEGKRIYQNYKDIRDLLSSISFPVSPRFDLPSSSNGRAEYHPPLELKADLLPDFKPRQYAPLGRLQQQLLGLGLQAVA